MIRILFTLILSLLLVTPNVFADLSFPPNLIEKQFLPPNNFYNPSFEANNSNGKSLAGTKLLGPCAGDSSGAAPTSDQTCGVSPSLTVTIDKTSKLIDRGADLKIAKASGSSRQGEYVIIDFEIEQYQKSKTNTLSFLNYATSNFVYGDSGDINVFLFDKTTSAPIPLSKKSMSGAGVFAATYLATANSVYQLVLWIPVTTTLAWDLHVKSLRSELTRGITVAAPKPESVTLTGYTSKSTNDILFKTVQENSSGTLITYASVGSVSRFTVLRNSKVDLTASVGQSSAANFIGIVHYNSAASVLKTNFNTFTGVERSVSMTTNANAGDYFIAQTSATPTDVTYTNFSIKAIDANGGTNLETIPNNNLPSTLVAYKSGGSAFSGDTAIPSWTSVDATNITFSSSTGIGTIIQPGDYYFYWTFRQTGATTGSAGIYVTCPSGSFNRFGITNTSADSKQVGTLIKGMVAGCTFFPSSSAGATLTTSTELNFLSAYRINTPDTVLPMNRTTTKILGTTVSATATDIADLRMSNLVIGKRYSIRLDANFATPITGTDNYVQLIAVHNATNLTRSVLRTGTVAGYTVKNGYSEFVAAATTLTFNSSVAGTGSINGDGTYTSTTVTLTELNNTIPGGF